LSPLGYSFPTNATIATNGLLLIVPIDPATFRAKYGVPSAVPIFGPYSGVLQDSGVTLVLQRPDQPDLDTNTGTYFIPYIDVDVVRYNDKAPWPTNADGFGPSLERLNATAYGNDPINWRASRGPASPGLENTGNRPPVVNAGPDQSLSGTSFPLVVALSGSATGDGQPNPPSALTMTWSQVSGPGTAWFGNVNQPNTTATFPGTGTYVLRLTASDGALQASDDLTVTIQRSPSPVTFVAKGRGWNYWDQGTDLGTAWRATNYNSVWASRTGATGLRGRQ
jgi:hypothetical protein